MLPNRFVFGAVILLTLSTLASASPKLDAGTGTQMPLISISLKKTSMEDALNKISTIVGYEITVSRDWANRAISIDLQDRCLEDSLVKILYAAGNPSYFMITDKDKRTIEIMIMGPARASVTGREGDRGSGQTRSNETGIRKTRSGVRGRVGRLPTNAAVAGQSRPLRDLHMNETVFKILDEKDEPDRNGPPAKPFTPAPASPPGGSRGNAGSVSPGGPS